MKETFFLGVGAGAAFSAGNLFLFRCLASFLAAPRKNRRLLIVLLLLKFGVLYPAAIAALYFQWVSAWGFLLGFTGVLGAAAYHAVRFSSQVN